MLRPPGLIAHAVALLEIAAGAKRLLAVAGDDHHARLFQIDRERFEQLHEIEPHARVQRVRYFGPIERDQQDVIVVAGNDDRLKIGAHRMLLRSSQGLLDQGLLDQALIFRRCLPSGNHPRPAFGKPAHRGRLATPA